VARHYLDHASTSPLRPEARSALTGQLAAVGDPGRVHEEGRAVRASIEAAREQVAAFLGVRPRQVVFTSGGTEAINAGVLGAATAAPSRAMVAAAVEHSAVREASARAGPVRELPVDRSGRIDADALVPMLAAAPSDRPALVHCQWANHETGTIQPVAEIVGLCREAGVPVHVDACAAVGHLETDLGELGADLVSVSAHKFGGPAGIGALVVAPGRRFAPLLLGGAQERARRAGFENGPAICGFGAAAAALGQGGRLATEAAAARRRIARVLEAASCLEGVGILGEPDPDGRVPHLVCLGIEGVEAEAVVVGLDRAGIAVHSGSACSSEVLEPSPVLAAMGVDAERSLRVSVGWSTTDEDVDAFAAAFGPVLEDLRALRA
jgi:cysteine desulfurase